MRWKQSLWILVLGLTACLAGAQGTQGATILGIGAKSCGTWVQAREGRGQIPEAAQDEFTEWAEGYLSGVSDWTSFNPTRRLDVGALQTWVDSYCQNHPLDLFAGALNALIRSRSRR